MDITAREPAQIADLLEQEPFLHAIARRLLRDREEAEDLVQETWVASLQGLPAGVGSGLRPWLARVARNLAANRFRRRLRQPVHALELRQGARGEPTSPAAAEVVAGESVQQALLAALERLPEACRAPIVLHYYEGLPPRRIAEVLAVPVETVRTRIKRGLARMRTDLERNWGRNRGDWVGALLAWLPSAGGPEPRARLRPRGLSLGAGALVLGTALWIAAEASSTPDRAPTEAASDAVATTSRASRAGVLGRDEPAQRTTLRPESSFLSIRIVVAEDETPVSGAELAVQQGSDEHGLRTDEHGRCGVELDLARPAVVDVRRTPVSAPLHEVCSLAGVRAADELVLRVPRGSVLHGRLSDSAGNPVRSGEVLVYEEVEPVASAEGWPAPTLAVSANADGAFVLSGLGRRFTCLARSETGLSQGGLRAELDQATELRDVEFVLAPARSLAGTVRDERGTPVPGATVAVSGGSSRRTTVRNTTGPGAVWVDQIAATTLTDEHGRFALEGLVRGVASLTVRHPDYPAVDQMLAPFDEAASAPVEVALVRGVELDVTVLDARSSPCVGAAVRCLAERDTMTLLEAQQLATGTSGRCRLPAAVPGTRLTLRVDPPGGPPVLCTANADPSREALVLRAPAARALRGIVCGPDGTHLPACRVELHWGGLDARDPLLRRELSRLAVLPTDADGSFSVAALPDVELVAEVSCPSLSRAGIHRIPAGVTEIELRPGAGDWLLSGRIFDASQGRSLGAGERTLLHAFERSGERRTARVEVRDGAYRLSLPARGEWWLCAQAEGYAARVVAVVAGSTSTLDLPLFLERTLAILVQDENGSPLGGGSLVIDDEDGQRWPVWKRPGLGKNAIRLGPSGAAVLAGLPAKPVRLTLRPDGLSAPLVRIVDLASQGDSLTWELPGGGSAPRSPARLELKRASERGDLEWYEGTGAITVRGARGELLLSWGFAARSEACELLLGPEGLSVDYDEQGRIDNVRGKVVSQEWASATRGGADAARVPAFDFALPPGSYQVEVSAPGFDPAPRDFVLAGGSLRAEPWILWADSAPREPAR